ncbi:MAG TPA: SWIM zinc finger family protein [Ilumatobacteraceae bacterium]
MSAPRWSIEQVAAVAPSPSSLAAAEDLTHPARWSAAGGDDRVLWGRCRGSGAEPYDTMVDHADVAWRCSCPSRRQPCKHAIALLMMWVRAVLPEGVAPATVARWADERVRRAGTGSGGSADAGSHAGSEPSPEPPAPDPAPETDAPSTDRSRDERVAKMLEGLVELDRWIDDRMRTGLADPQLARYATWDDLAARLVDARAGALANRIRRLAGLVGASPDWHSEVLAELGVLHLLASGGRRVPELPDALADATAVAAGWQVRQADVLAGVPETDTWIVAGRSDTREDRIEVRRIWLRGAITGRWAMVLSFAAYRQSLDTSLTVGTAIECDLHRYPGGSLRALVGRHDAPPVAARPPAATVREACGEIGAAVAREPWIERVPATVHAAPALLDNRWVLTDDTDSMPLDTDPEALAVLLAASAGASLDVTVEWTPRGVVPLAIHLDDRCLDIGPRADPSFVSAA